MLHLSAHGRQEKLEERLSALMQSIDSATSEARRSSANIEHLQVSPPHPPPRQPSPQRPTLVY